MNKPEQSNSTMESSDSYDTRQSKQRASIKWLLSKAYNNRVPDNLREPFYRDHEEQQHLKPPIVGSLANAELYCQALANIYSDPNYHSLNQWNILQTLSRKGAPVTDPPHCPLTETVLINTNPLKMNAHMAVIEAMMALYAKEVVRWERVSAALTRFGAPALPGLSASTVTAEEGLLLWVRGAYTALAGSGPSSTTVLPTSLQELCDGAALVSLVRYYCGQDTIVGDNSTQESGRPRSLQESLSAARALRHFCRTHLPHDIFHMEPEDLTYMRGSMKQNLIVMLADLFNVLEIHPAKCVKYPSSEVPRSPSASQVHSRGRGSVGSTQRSACSTPEYRSHTPPPQQNPEESFVVHRGKQVTTLSSLARQDEGGAAGRPSDWESRRSGAGTYAGRRSRRSSISDDSQLTVENFGGSQDQLNFLGRNPEKELATVQSSSRSNTPARKISAPAGPIEQATPVRSTLQDARGSIQFFYDEPSNGSYSNDEKQQKSLDRQYSQPHSQNQYEPIRRQLSSDTITLKPSYNNFPDRGGGDESFYLSNKDYPDGDSSSPKMTFADLTKYRTNGDQAGIQLVYMQHGKEDILHQQHQPKKKNAPPPVQTTWQQLKLQHDIQSNGGPTIDSTDDAVGGGGEARLAEVRLALEERRRRIETDKRRAEAAFDRQRRALGHHAFLQAVTKNKSSADTGSGIGEEEIESPSRPTTLQDIPPEKDNRRKNSNDMPYVENKRTPDYDGLGIEEYQHSISKMNSNLQDIQNDIARLTNQQNQIQASQMYHQHYQNTHNIPQLHNQYGSAHNISGSPYSVNTFGSTPHISELHQQQRHSPHIPQISHFQPDPSSQFYLHEQQQPRRAWAPSPAPQHTQTPPPQHPPPLHHTPPSQLHHLHHPPENDHNAWQAQIPQYQPQRVQYPEPQRVWSSPSPQPSEDVRAHGDGFMRSSPSPAPAPRYQNGGEQRVSLQQLGEQQTVRAPAARDMEPQSISFIGNAEEEAPQAIARLNITSGSRTYRLPSPTRPSIARDSFERPLTERDEKGFYVSFESDRPKRAKPPLRSERSSPKKENAYNDDGMGDPPPVPIAPPRNQQRMRLAEARNEYEHKPPEQYRERDVPPNRAKSPAPAALVVGDLEPEAEEAEEMERKKERIMMLSLQRRQRAEASRAATEAQAAARRAADEAAAERRANRKEEQQRRRDAILHRHKLKKAIEEAEREGKVVDKAELAALCMAGEALGHGPPSGATTARLRGSAGPPSKRQQRPARPNTIHVDGGAVERATDGLMLGRSSNNLSGHSPTIRRDYYRGSQDSLADRAGLYKDSPVEESRGMSPGSVGGGGSGILGRRGSCKTSRERINEVDPPPLARGRSKYSTYQNNFKAGRKSTSLMNLCADSGLGRATPPRRAASPGMGGRTLPSPSGAPPSLPHSHIGASAAALQRRLRTFDDASSDLSSTPSSMIDYSGPRLYKQPATKSNRGIMLNAVEYCVFPGVVNREAKRRVLEEIARSDAKHFLVLFRDAGCQFRALYEYCPEQELVNKLYGTGPRTVNDRMFDKFFKYNSGSKCFSVVHTKHLTVTIDAFTIHNSLWQGKKVHLPSKKDMALVI